MRSQPTEYRRAVANLYIRLRRLRDETAALGAAHGYGDYRTQRAQNAMIEVHNGLQCMQDAALGGSASISGSDFLYFIKLHAKARRRRAVSGLSAAEASRFIRTIGAAAENAYGDHWNLKATDGHLSDDQVESLEAFLETGEVTGSEHVARIIESVMEYGRNKFGKGEYGRAFTIDNLSGEMHTANVGFVRQIVKALA